MMKLNRIKANPDNPRVLRDERFEQLKHSLKEFPEMMELRPIIVDEDGIVLGGNMRLKALVDLGYKEVPDTWIRWAPSLTEAQRREFIIKDNVAFGEWNWDLLLKEWDTELLTEWGLELPDWQTAAEEEGEADAEARIDQADELNKVWMVQPGDTWQIGVHRLKCGDATSVEIVKDLLDSASPELMVTDPPYGIDYDPSWRVTAGVNKNEKKQGKVKNDDRADWTPAWQLSPSTVAYVWHAGLRAAEVQASLEVSGFEVVSQIIWAKDRFALSRGDYHWKHEPCWYAIKSGSTHRWGGARDQHTIWEIPRADDDGHGHSTQKPVECMARAIRNHEGDVYEPFAGSGTTFVAAQNLHRTCYGIEIHPPYCAVILDRMTRAFPDIDVRKITK